MRYPAVAGSFYTSSASNLRAEIEGYLSKVSPKVQKRKILAIVSPHAGYMYSGRCAAYSFAACSNWSSRNLTAVIIGPNHTGMGSPISVSFDDWKTPLGEVKCDLELAGEIVKAGKIASRDEVAHFREHSCEVQLPFLQICAPSAKAVCICMGWQDSASAQDLGKAIFESVKKTRREAVVIASSDFTHYESAESARKKDMMAISMILDMDWVGFEEFVETKNLSICGHGPIAAALHYSKLFNAKRCELLHYTNSGEASGDFENVVAYAAIAIGK
ncbi:MAG: MEMO1 family protein [Candidatus Anstonellaceae archaeon]